VSILRRGDTWHFDFVVKGDRHRGTTGVRATTKKPPAEVVAWVAEKRKAAVLGASNRPQTAYTLEYVADLWFAARKAGTKSEVTCAYHLETMLRIMGRDTLITAIDELAIIQGIQKRRLDVVHAHRKGARKAPTNSTITRDLIDTTLRPMLRYAKKVLKLQVQDVEWSEVRLPEPRERLRSFTADEIKAWRDALPADFRPVFDFVSVYGARLAEAFFPPENVDVAAGRVTLKDRKNGKDHTLPLLPADASAMAARVSRAKAAGLTTVWFREVKAGGLAPITRRGFQDASRRALQAIGLADVRPVHDLRHHAATEALRRSGNLAVVKQLLGHDDITSTMRYAHTADADVLAALGHKPTTQNAAKAKKPLNIKAI
jgi:integrase